MLAWHDWAAFCVNKSEFEKPKIRQRKCTIAEDLVCLETLVQSSPCAPSITGLEIPQFTSLDLKASLLIGGLHKRISLIKSENC
jgi:hypothetical protein